MGRSALTGGVRKETVVLDKQEATLEVRSMRAVDAARGLVDARYGALGAGREPHRLAQFITLGPDDEMHLAIGSPPEGRGILAC